MTFEPAEAAGISMTQGSHDPVLAHERPCGVHMRLVADGTLAVDDAQRAAHAEMHEQASVRPLDEQLLAQPMKALETASRRQWNRRGALTPVQDVVAEHPRMAHARTPQATLERAPQTLHFRQFRHA